MIALWLDGLPGLGSRSFDKLFVGLLGFVATWKLSNHRPESSSLAKLRVRGRRSMRSERWVTPNWVRRL
jgi:hypothetical protein